MANQLLMNRNVLIATSAPQIELVSELEALGARVILLPPLRIGPCENYAALDEALENLYGYDWIIFANIHAVDYFLDRLKHSGRDVDDLDALQICAAGEQTAHQLENMRVHVDLIPEQLHSEAIYSTLATYVEGPENLRRLNFLMPRSAIAGDLLAPMLEDSGARVDAVAAYRTVAAAGNELTNLITLFRGGGIDCATFTSPASVNELAELLDTNDPAELLKGVAIACYDGPTVVAAAALGLKANIVASTASACASEIALHFQK